MQQLEKVGGILSFYVLSKDYDKVSGRFRLFVGSDEQHDELDAVELPAGVYGRVIVTPKLGFIWSPAIGEAKRRFYTKWLPVSGYTGLNMEYEYHMERSVGKRAEIDLFFAIKESN